MFCLVSLLKLSSAFRWAMQCSWSYWAMVTAWPTRHRVGKPCQLWGSQLGTMNIWGQPHQCQSSFHSIERWWLLRQLALLLKQWLQKILWSLLIIPEGRTVSSTHWDEHGWKCALLLPPPSPNFSAAQEPTAAHLPLCCDGGACRHGPARPLGPCYLTARGAQHAPAAWEWQEKVSASKHLMTAIADNAPVGALFLLGWVSFPLRAYYWHCLLLLKLHGWKFTWRAPPVKQW